MSSGPNGGDFNHGPKSIFLSGKSSLINDCKPKARSGALSACSVAGLGMSNFFRAPRISSTTSDALLGLSKTWCAAAMMIQSGRPEAVRGHLMSVHQYTLATGR